MQMEYLQTPVSLAALAERYGLSAAQVQRRARQENWAKLKKALRLMEKQLDGAVEVKQPAAGKTAGNDAHLPDTGRNRQGNARALTAGETGRSVQAAPVAGNAAERGAQLTAIGDRLTALLAQATSELDKQVLLHKRRTREMTYEDPQGKGKPIEETVEERVQLEVVDAPVNSMGLKHLSDALKILREVTRADSGSGESVRLVAQLMQKLDDESRFAREENAEQALNPGELAVGAMAAEAAGSAVAGETAAEAEPAAWEEGETPPC